MHSTVQWKTAPHERLLLAHKPLAHAYHHLHSIGYCRTDASLDDWKPLASLVLNAAYQATTLAAFFNAQRHQFKGNSAKVIKGVTPFCDIHWHFSSHVSLTIIVFRWFSRW